MNIPDEVLQQLKCDQCDEYLSCSPVYFLHENFETICGRCAITRNNGSVTSETISTGTSNNNTSTKTTDTETNYSKITKSRNKQYEALASLFKFPCKYAENGCLEKLPFSEQQHQHEKKCQYKERLCPVSPSGQCNWLGSWNNLRKHCQLDHPHKIISNGYKFMHDITKSTLDSFLVTTFNLLFILYIKICKTTGKIYHSVRLLGDEMKEENFEFIIEMERNGMKLSKPGKVLSEGILAIQEKTSVEVNINNLIGVFDGFDGTTFTITIKNKVSIGHYCEFCPVQIKEPVDGEIICDKCSDLLCNCKNLLKGCMYRDVREKCRKHESYYCKYVNCPTNCGTLCVSNFFEHYMEEHNAIEVNIESTFYVRCYSADNQRFILSSNIGNIICVVNLSQLEFCISIRTPLKNKELHNYQCTLVLKNCKKIEKICTLDNILYLYDDWQYELDVDNFGSFKGGLYIQMLINKI